MWKWIVAPLMLTLCASVWFHETLAFNMCYAPSSWFNNGVKDEKITEDWLVPALRFVVAIIAGLMVWWMVKGNNTIKKKKMVKNEVHEDHTSAAPARRVDTIGDLPTNAVNISGGSIGSIGSIGGNHNHNHFIGRPAMESGAMHRVGRTITDNAAHEQRVRDLIECLHSENA